MPESIQTIKYTVPFTNLPFRILAPAGARFLAVTAVPHYMNEPDGAAGWMSAEFPLMHLSAPHGGKFVVYHTFLLLGPNSVSPAVPLDHMGTFVLEGGVLVFHVFELPDDQRPGPAVSPNFD